MYSIVTDRFNNETLDCNYSYRAKYNYECIYCVPIELSPKISYGSPVFVIEMNNSTNQIEGIGLIKNTLVTNKYYKVHIDGNNNRYIYIGNYYMSRDTINQYNSLLVCALDKALFKGYTHSKRGTGLTLFPEKVLQSVIATGINIKTEIKELFVRHFREKPFEAGST